MIFCFYFCIAFSELLTHMIYMNMISKKSRLFFLYCKDFFRRNLWQNLESKDSWPKVEPNRFETSLYRFTFLWLEKQSILVSKFTDKVYQKSWTWSNQKVFFSNLRSFGNEIHKNFLLYESWKNEKFCSFFHIERTD